MNNSGYNDFENLSRYIKNETNQLSNYQITFRKNGSYSKRFNLIKNLKSISFNLFFKTFEKGTNITKLCLQFEFKTYEIIYKNLKYYVNINDAILDLNKDSLTKIFDEMFKFSNKASNEKIFPDSFIVGYAYSTKKYPIDTPFFCPECLNGKLQILDKDSINSFEYKKYNKMIREDYPEDYDRDWFKYSFAGFLTCNNCSEKIGVLGSASFDECFIQQKGNCYDSQILERYTIKYFDRVKDFIEIELLPSETLKEKLRESFLLYFSDKAACANKIRSFLDIFLTELGVSETTVDGNFRPLSKRIDECKKILKSQKDVLKILKNVGNEGSHGDGNLTKYDLYKTYIVIESLIKKIYKKKEEQQNLNELKVKFGNK